MFRLEPLRPPLRCTSNQNKMNLRSALLQVSIETIGYPVCYDLNICTITNPSHRTTFWAILVLMIMTKTNRDSYAPLRSLETEPCGARISSTETSGAQLDSTEVSGNDDHNLAHVLAFDCTEDGLTCGTSCICLET